jgi:hypothetical protein
MEIDGESGDEIIVEYRRRQKPAVSGVARGQPTAYLIVADNTAVGHDTMPFDVAHGAGQILSDGQLRLVCIVLGSWQVATDPVQFEDMEEFRLLSRARKCEVPLHQWLGFLCWRWDQMFKLSRWLSLPVLSTNSEWIAAALDSLGAMRGHDDVVSFRTCLGTWGESQPDSIPIVPVKVAPMVAWRVFNLQWIMFHVLPLYHGCRNRRFTSFEYKSPWPVVLAWMKQQPRPEDRSHSLLCGSKRKRGPCSASYKQRPLSEIVMWLKATSTLKAISAKTLALKSWGAIFDHAHGRKDSLADKVHEMGYETLRTVGSVVVGGWWVASLHSVPSA